MTDSDAFGRQVEQFAPRTAVVLGTGLSGVFECFQETSSLAFGAIPGLVPTTVSGHCGRVAIGLWDDVPILVFRGRLHAYEGNQPEVVTRSVKLVADWGVRTLVLTNAVGGINPALRPGSLMAIRRHMKLLGPDDWRVLARDREEGRDASGTVADWPYSARLIEVLEAGEKAAGRALFSGVYAAVSGPCFETPAEIRALAACGADAVGMSTVLEAEAGANLGLEVAAISCATNAAAGMGAGDLGHADVLRNAQLGVGRLGEMLRHLTMAFPSSTRLGPRCSGSPR